jgi:hypothetical protein
MHLQDEGHYAPIARKYRAADRSTATLASALTNWSGNAEYSRSNVDPHDHPVKAPRGNY